MQSPPVGGIRDNMNKQNKYAYLAGILDGEGYVGIKKSTYGMRHNTCKNPTYSERVQVKMSIKDIPELFQKEFGGGLMQDNKVYQSKSGFKNNSKMWVYRASDKIAANLLRTLLPYIRLKRPQAKYCLKLRKSKESKAARLRGGQKQKRLLSPKIQAQRESWYLAIKAIHKK